MRKYKIFFAVASIFLVSCVSHNDYELIPKNYFINKEFDEVLFDMNFINTEKKIIEKLKKTTTYPVHCESNEKDFDVFLFGFTGTGSSNIKDRKDDSLTGGVHLCSNGDIHNCIKSKFKKKRYTFHCEAVFYESMSFAYRSKPFTIDFDTRNIKQER